MKVGWPQYLANLMHQSSQLHLARFLVENYCLKPELTNAQAVWLLPMERGLTFLQPSLSSWSSKAPTSYQALDRNRYGCFGKSLDFCCHYLDFYPVFFIKLLLWSSRIFEEFRFRCQLQFSLDDLLDFFWMIFCAILDPFLSPLFFSESFYHLYLKMHLKCGFGCRQQSFLKAKDLCSLRHKNCLRSPLRFYRLMIDWWVSKAPNFFPSSSRSLRFTLC